MRILVIGDWHSKLHEDPLFKGFLAQGQEALKFSWHQYFIPKGHFKFFKSLLLRIQNKYRFGPQVKQINKDIHSFISEHRPEAIFFYRGSHIYPQTIKQIRLENKNVILVGYNNDDPFSPLYPKWVWRHHRRAIKYFDLVLAYRPSNIEEYYEFGAKSVKLLRSWYLPEINKPVQLTKKEIQDYGCDIAFIGHYEDDERADYLEEILVHGLSLNLYGPGYDWDPKIKNFNLLRHKIPVKLIWGHDYNKALSGAKIALCFLSKLNRDSYTRRCFEIPASGTMMLAEYSDDLATLFQEGKEAEFFRNKQEMIEKITSYLSNEPKRLAVSKGGRNRVIDDGHDAESRAREIIIWIKELME